MGERVREAERDRERARRESMCGETKRRHARRALDTDGGEKGKRTIRCRVGWCLQCASLSPGFSRAIWGRDELHIWGRSSISAHERAMILDGVSVEARQVLAP